MSSRGDKKRCGRARDPRAMNSGVQRFSGPAPSNDGTTNVNTGSTTKGGSRSVNTGPVSGPTPSLYDNGATGAKNKQMFSYGNVGQNNRHKIKFTGNKSEQIFSNHQYAPGNSECSFKGRNPFCKKSQRFADHSPGSLNNDKKSSFMNNAKQPASRKDDHICADHRPAPIKNDQGIINNGPAQVKNDQSFNHHGPPPVNSDHEIAYHRAIVHAHSVMNMDLRKSTSINYNDQTTAALSNQRLADQNHAVKSNTKRFPKHAVPTYYEPGFAHHRPPPVINAQGFAHHGPVAVIHHGPPSVNNYKGVVLYGSSPMNNDQEIFHHGPPSVNNDRGVVQYGSSQMINDQEIFHHGPPSVNNDRGVVQYGSSPMINDQEIFYHGPPSVNNDRGIVQYGSSPMINDQEIFHHGPPSVNNDRGVVLYGSSPMINDQEIFHHGPPSVNNDRGVVQYGSSSIINDQEIFHHGLSPVNLAQIFAHRAPFAVIPHGPPSVNNDLGVVHFAPPPLNRNTNVSGTKKEQKYSTKKTAAQKSGQKCTMKRQNGYKEGHKFQTNKPDNMARREKCTENGRSVAVSSRQYDSTDHDACGPDERTTDLVNSYFAPKMAEVKSNHPDTFCTGEDFERLVLNDSEGACAAATSEDYDVVHQPNAMGPPRHLDLDGYDIKDKSNRNRLTSPADQRQSVEMSMPRPIFQRPSNRGKPPPPPAQEPMTENHMDMVRLLNRQWNKVEEGIKKSHGEVSEQSWEWYREKEPDRNMDNFQAFDIDKFWEKRTYSNLVGKPNLPS